MPPFFSLVIPGRLPSWNQILAMHHWQRKKFKDQLAHEFLSALRQSASDCSIPTTSARNTTLTYAATLALFLTTRRIKSKSKSRSAKPKMEKRNLQK